MIKGLIILILIVLALAAIGLFAKVLLRDLTESSKLDKDKPHESNTPRS